MNSYPFKCCPEPTILHGTIFGVFLLPVTVCDNCDETRAQFNRLGQYILFICDYFFNTEDGFTIKLKLTDETNNTQTRAQ